MEKPDPYTDFFGHLVDHGGRREELASFLDNVGNTIDLYADALLEYYGERNEEIYLYSESFPTTLYKAFLIMLAIHTEQELRSVCALLRRHLNTPLALSDLSGSTVDRFLKFLKGIAKLDVPLTQTDCADLKGFFDIRNCLVHADGALDDFSKRNAVLSFARRHGVPEIAENRLIIDRKTCDVCLTRANQILDRSSSMHRAVSRS